ncbi:MAG: hypothetical protein P1U56_05885 [Saprospiraceae bacterium]|nr:hypothetical protein [Saprospiraceae bacterium]
MKKRLCIIGLEQELAAQIKKSYFGPVIYHVCIPKFIVNKGILYIEKSNGVGFLPVDIVLFHGIYENDLDFITALTIWKGACFPNPYAMMNCRLKLPCLARALRVSKYNSIRGMVSPETTFRVDRDTVAKWGNWHCGENKHRFDSNWTSTEASVLEPFFEGKAVRIVSIGDQHLQINLDGNDWLKSIHHPDAEITDIDSELLEDTLNLKRSFGMEMIANDYIIGVDGQNHLLEVNHIPNVTRFERLQTIYLEEVKRWLDDQ